MSGLTVPSVLQSNARAAHVSRLSANPPRVLLNGLAFDKEGRLYVTDSYGASPLFAIFDVFVDDKAGKLFREFED